MAKGSFDTAEFSGGEVSFNDATFSGGEVGHGGILRRPGVVQQG
jgi:hypothetical protein